MRFLITAFSVLILFGCAPSESAEQTPDGTEAPQEASTGYDAALAEELGADEYGMRQYVMAFLKSGPNRSADSTEAAKLQRAHLDNIKRLAEEGQLLLAGPFLDNGPVRGIYIFDVRTIEEAKTLTESDPSIQAGVLEMELHPWYGSAAIMKLNEIHSRVQKKGI